MSNILIYAIIGVSVIGLYIIIKKWFSFLFYHIYIILYIYDLIKIIT